MCGPWTYAYQWSEDGSAPKGVGWRTYHLPLQQGGSADCVASPTHKTTMMITPKSSKLCLKTPPPIERRLKRKRNHGDNDNELGAIKRKLSFPCPPFDEKECPGCKSPISPPVIKRSLVHWDE